MRTEFSYSYNGTQGTCSDLTVPCWARSRSVTACKEWQSTARLFQQFGKVTHFASLLEFV